tara:strand:- start:4598 stop:5437 length:840 start_codon:yes stop_codon:yes gene_type:complete
MSFRGFTNAKHSDGALNDLEARIKNSFAEISNSRILGGRLLSGVKLKSTGTTSANTVFGVGRCEVLISSYSDIPGTDCEIHTNNTFRQGKEGVEWSKGADATEAATNFASYFSTAAANLVCTSSGATIEVLTGTASVLQSVMFDDKDGVDSTANPIQSVQPAVRLGSVSSGYVNGDYVRFGPSTLSATGRCLPGMSRVISLNAETSGSGYYLLLDGFTSAMEGGLYIYKAMRNNIPGTNIGTKYFIVNQDKPAKIFRGQGSGNLSLLCDDDCTVDMWVF